MFFFLSQQPLCKVILCSLSALDGQGVKIFVGSIGKLPQLIGKRVEPWRHRGKDGYGLGVSLSWEAEIGTSDKCLGHFEDIVGFTADPAAPGDDGYDGHGEPQGTLDESSGIVETFVDEKLGLVCLNSSVCLDNLGICSRVLMIGLVSPCQYR